MPAVAFQAPAKSGACARRAARLHWCRVEAVQQTLADLTGIPKADQILMCEGARLDGSKPLDAYGLPGVSPPSPPV
jgi:hypothetical protein